MVDWNLQITEYFNMTEEEREDVIVGLADFYYNRWVNAENQEIFDFTINELMFRLEMEHRFAVKTESYERAEIYFKLLRVFNEIKLQKTFD
jgi:hypothetical protein